MPGELLNILFSLLVIVLLRPLRELILPKPAQVTQEPAPGRQSFFDSVKGIAIVAVVLIHVLKLYPEYYHLRTGEQELLSLLNNLSRFAIGFFLISSGILLQPLPMKAGPSWRFFSSKLVRIAGPYTICVILICIADSCSAREALHYYLTGQAATPYYFVIVIFQLYLVYPLICSWRSARWFLPVALACSIASLIFLPGTGAFFASYFYFFAYGVARRESWWREATAGSNAAPLAIIFLYLLGCLLFPGSYFNHPYFYTVALFELLSSFRHRLPVSAGLLSPLGINSLWIFLLHFLVVMLTCKIFRGYSSSAPVNLTIISTISILISQAAGVICAKAYQGVADGLAMLIKKLTPR